jgi:hypothetical protein
VPFQPYTGVVQGGGGASGGMQLVSAGDDPTLIVNNDIANTFYLGYDTGVNPSRPNVIAVPPQGSFTADGTQDLFAICLAGQTAAVQTLPAGSNWNNPVGVSLAIAAAGLATAANQVAQNNTAVATNDVLGTGIALPLNAAKETGGMLEGTTPGALVGISGNTIGKEIAAWIAGGAVGATPGGVPLLTASNSLINAGSILLTTGTQTFGPFTITQPGYDIAIDITSTGAGLVGVGIIAQWNDSVSGALVSEEEWDILPGPVGSFNNIIGTGPTKGNQLTLKMNVTNGGPVTVSGIITLLQNSRIYKRDDWRMYLINGATGGLATASPDLAANFLGSAHPNLAASGGNSTYVLPLYAGRISLSVASTSNTNDAFITVQQSANPSPSPQIIAFPTAVGQSGGATAIVTLPRQQCTVTINNENAAIKTVTWSAVALD